MANASLLDEATAAAEAMGMFLRLRKDANANVYLVDEAVHPQVLAVIKSRAQWMGVQVKQADLLSEEAQLGCDLHQVFGAHVQIPNTQGRLADCTVIAERLHAQAARLSVGCDLLALMLTKPPGEMGADVALGNAQRFGVPMGFGGPHAAFFAVKADLVRAAPGRIIGVSVDAAGKPAYRMSLQTREQHIRRDKATSKYLHCPGLACQHGKLLCGLSRARGASPYRNACECLYSHACAGTVQGGFNGCSRKLLRYPAYQHRLACQCAGHS
jgi:Glycine cleavage system protein P (pyridoxal-binding), N-terminal domain